MIKITKVGWIYILITIFLGIAAANTGNNLIYLIVSAMLSFMAVSGFLGKLNFSKLSVEILLPDEVYASKEVPVGIVLHNRKRIFPTFLIRVKLHDKYVLFPFVEGNSSKTKYIYTVFNNRGYTVFREIYLCSIFPFNFFIRCKKQKLEKKVLVYPKPRKCSLQSSQSYKNNKTGTALSEKKGYKEDILSIRDYSYADPIKYVHWKASAKTGSLKVKELSDETVKPVVIDLNAVSGDIEYRVSCATYIVIDLYKSSIPFGLKIGKKFIKPQYSKKQKHRVLRELALYGKH